MEKKICVFLIVSLFILTIASPVIGMMQIDKKSTMNIIENLAPNPSFEEGTGETPQWWEVGEFGNYGKFNWYSNESYNGENVLVFLR